MKITKLVHKVTIGSKVKSINTEETTYIVSELGNYTSRYNLKNGYIINKDGTIQGIDRVIDTYRVIPYKRYTFKYKR